MDVAYRSGKAVAKVAGGSAVAKTRAGLACNVIYLHIPGGDDRRGAAAGIRLILLEQDQVAVGAGGETSEIKPILNLTRVIDPVISGSIGNLRIVSLNADHIDTTWDRVAGHRGKDFQVLVAAGCV